MSTPNPNLGRESNPWANRMMERLTAAEGVASRNSTFVNNVKKSLGELTQSVSSRIGEMALTVAGLATTIADLTLDSIGGTLDQSKVTGVWDKEVTTSAPVTVGNLVVNGTQASNGHQVMDANSDLFTPHGRATPVVSSFVAAYLNGDGRLGATTSSRRFKQDIETWTPETQGFFALELVRYRRIAAVEQMGDDAPWEEGVIAEELVRLGLGWLVVFDDDGQPFSVAYEKIALLLIPVVQDHERRLLAAGL